MTGCWIIDEGQMLGACLAIGPALDHTAEWLELSLSTILQFYKIDVPLLMSTDNASSNLKYIRMGTWESAHLGWVAHGVWMSNYPTPPLDTTEDG